MQVQAANVQVMTERPASGTDVLVRAVANGNTSMDGKPLAGFFTRRRYQGDTFFIQKPEEFSAKWMEFAEDPPTSWLATIKRRYPEFDQVKVERERFEANDPRTMADVGNIAKIQSGDFDYSNGGPRKRVRTRQKLNLEG